MRLPPTHLCCCCTYHHPSSDRANNSVCEREGERECVLVPAKSTNRRPLLLLNDEPRAVCRQTQEASCAWLKQPTGQKPTRANEGRGFNQPSDSTHQPRKQTDDVYTAKTGLLHALFSHCFIFLLSKIFFGASLDAGMSQIRCGLRIGSRAGLELCSACPLRLWSWPRQRPLLILSIGHASGLGSG